MVLRWSGFALAWLYAGVVLRCGGFALVCRCAGFTMRGSCFALVLLCADFSIALFLALRWSGRGGFVLVRLCANLALR